MSIGQVDTITQYIAEHPGCTMGEIVRETGQNKSSVASTLHRLTACKVFRRERGDKFFRYYVEDASPRRHSARAIKQVDDPRAINPLTNLFNQRLAEVRGGR